MSRRAVILAAFFVLGGYAVCAQATLLRETQVILFGSELSWGLVLAFWLAGVAAGAWIGGWPGRGARPHRPVLLFSATGLLMPALLLGNVLLLRVARLALGVGPGEYVGPGAMLLVSVLATAPVSVFVGLAFPAASAMLAREEDDPAAKARAIGWVYLVESLGSLAGGVLFSFVLVERVGAAPLVLGGGAILALSVAPVARRASALRWPGPLLLVFAAAQVTVLAAGGGGRLEDASVRARWSSFASGLELVRSIDTRYQNVALGRLGEQFSLYTNGLVDATWPDDAELATKAHLAACEQPGPRRMLVVGGGAEGLLKELRRYGPDRLDFVTLDAKLLGLMRDHLAPADREALDALGDGVHFADARRFVKRAAAEGRRYDLVLLAAPEPASTLEARLYTEEFFAELADAMSDEGVLVFALSGAVGYWGPAPAEYVGSIVLALESSYPDVLLTFGYPTYCFAAKRKGVLATTGEALAARYRARGITSPHFDPLWFEGATDMLDAEKRESVHRALAVHRPAFLNTDARPAAALYRMRFWLQTSAAAHAGPGAPAEHRADVLGAVLKLRFEWLIPLIVGATLLAGLIGLARGRAAVRRTAVLWSVGSTGFASMALEVVLLYTFQTLYGYVYSMIGLVVGVFMFGLVVGSLTMNRCLRRGCGDPSRRPGLRTVLAIDLALTLFAAAMVVGLGLLRTSTADWPVQAATFALVGVSGVLGGLVIPLAASVSLDERVTTARAAGAVDAADHLGACLGALATGVVLVPVLGTSGACLVVALMKAMSALLVGAASAAGRSASAQAVPDKA